MIENEAQCQATKGWMARFREDLHRLDTCPPPDLEPPLLRAIRNGLESQIDNLQRQVTAYETGIPEPPRELAPEQQKMVEQARKDFAERFGDKAKRALEEIERAIP